MKKGIFFIAGLAASVFSLWNPPVNFGQEQMPFYLKDRGPGISTSMFGTYIRKGELIIYPFFEYYYDNNMEYKPSELGFGVEEDYRGKYRGSEGLIFFGYGLSDRIAIELEAAMIQASLSKSSMDTSGMPQKLTESGLGDVQTQLNWRWLKESDRRPELFSYLEVVFPHHKNKVLIGTSEWETKAGIGLIRGFAWGTMTVRAAIEHAGSTTDLGEWAVEYFKRLSPSWRLYAGIEGTQDELEFIAEVQWYLNDRVRIKINNALGLTSKATGWAPEIGIMFSIY